MLEKGVVREGGRRGGGHAKGIPMQNKIRDLTVRCVCHCATVYGYVCKDWECVCV